MHQSTWKKSAVFLFRFSGETWDAVAGLGKKRPQCATPTGGVGGTAAIGASGSVVTTRQGSGLGGASGQAAPRVIIEFL